MFFTLVTILTFHWYVLDQEPYPFFSYIICKPSLLLLDVMKIVFGKKSNANFLFNFRLGVDAKRFLRCQQNCITCKDHKIRGVSFFVSDLNRRCIQKYAFNFIFLLPFLGLFYRMFVL
eukprot:TRINITY_DN4661_c0_g1_i2.p4 TRINITY_DN4661_c0_g1~~TRINITY_DN4661_c0_g1_i2.p4  ORF type:complete len:118 (-),score=0.84 TRINITY_DN4661_c0_g1_i2:387-740(-)